MNQIILRDFLRMYAKGQEWDAPHASIQIKKIWDLDVDWHKFVDTFEYLRNTEEAALTQGWGHCRYMIK